MSTPLSVLIVEDSETDAQILVHLLRKADYEITYERVETAEQTSAALKNKGWDIIISDYKLPQFDGYAALKMLQSTGQDIPFIVISGAISEEAAIEIMMAGAQDYLDKNDMTRLIPAIKREIRQSAIRRERRQAEEKLRESEERYRGLFDSMIDGLALHEILCDKNGKPVDYRFLEVNPANERVTGLQPAKLIGRTALEVLPDTEPYWINIYGNVALTGRSAFFESYFKELNRQFEVSAYCPRPGQFATVLVDITERKQAEEALRESEEQYRHLVNLLPSGIIVHGKGKILLANDSTVNLFGAENTQQLIGTALIERVHPDYRETVRTRIKDSLSTGINAPLIEEKLLRLDNTAFDAEVTALPISYAGEPSMLVVFNDITQRKKAEEELRGRLTELESAHNVSKALRTARVTEEVLPLLLDQILAALAAEAGAIWLYNPVKNELRAAGLAK